MFHGLATVVFLRLRNLRIGHDYDNLICCHLLFVGIVDPPLLFLVACLPNASLECEYV